MNVLHLIETTGPGGAETVFVDIATALSRRGHGSFPVVHGPGWVEDALRAAGVPPLMHVLGRTPDLSFIRRMRQFVRDERVDVIQTHLLGSSVYGALIGGMTGVPVVSTFHGVSDLGPRGLRRTVKSGAIRLGVTRAVFVSQALERALRPVLGLAPQRTEVVYNGIDCDRFSPGHDDLLRRQLRVRDDEILVGAVGNVRPAKDYATFLRTAAELSNRSARWRFVIVGEASGHQTLFNELIALREELRLGERVTLLGFQSDIPRILRGLDALLCTSTSEGFSLVICQALASGIPVVSTRCGGPEEILTDGQTGFLVEIGSTPALAAALQRLAEDPAMRARLVERGRAMVVSRFSTESMVDGYERVYQNACARGR